MPNRKIVHQAHESAFAKINLGLQVLGKRPDGFHEIRTLLQAVDLVDDLEIRFAPGQGRSLRFWCDRPELNNERNLAREAAARLMDRHDVPGSVQIRLWKRIPAGAGLGGGSSDAGAVLRGLANLLFDPPPDELLFEIAESLGSDVPYFLVGGAVAAAGRGTELKPVPELPRRWVALSLPDLEVSTGWAYSALAGKRKRLLKRQPQSPTMRTARPGAGAWERGGPEALAGQLFNDFESIVLQKYRGLRRIKRRLHKSGASHALLSGSGAAVFGIHDTREDAADAAELLNKLEPDQRAVTARFLTRADCGLALETDE